MKKQLLLMTACLLIVGCNEQQKINSCQNGDEDSGTTEVPCYFEDDDFNNEGYEPIMSDSIIEIIE